MTGSIGAQMGGGNSQTIDVASLVDPGWVAVRHLGNGRDGAVGLVPENYIRPSEETEAADAETNAYVWGDRFLDVATLQSLVLAMSHILCCLVH